MDASALHEWHRRGGAPALRLGVYKLPAAEVAVIRTIIMLYASDAAFPWTLVDAPPYDALLVDGTTTEGERSGLACAAGAVLALTRMNSGSLPHTMERPIRADKLKQWLKGIERALAQARPAQWGADEQTALEMEVSDSVRFSLRRWPSALMLRNDMDKVRMASLLSRRALNASELADTSQLPLSQCVTFLQALRTAGTLELHVASAASALGESSRSAAFAGAGRSEFARSLVNGIRRRLGL
jgi:hypothetical protein